MVWWLDWTIRCVWRTAKYLTHLKVANPWNSSRVLEVRYKDSPMPYTA